ncbi:N utilization substance protein B [Halorhodospira abdelmalekii]|uniref:transcription antitermination factor NusB n=1 Tax=Halorhodospira abdelmalekii TaxID=421629 RepID=UPI001906CEAB|nr:transcription antitermination factor NusB [Halorhodospira abdelmalekii]MBK1734698.1 N utilization substance protein B [Halorhodospira abdelmalekii]
MDKGRERHARSLARSRLVQALYQFAVTGQGAAEIEQQFIDNGLGESDVAYFRETIHAVIAQANELDGRLAMLLDRPLAQLDPVERSVLRLGAYELVARYDVPCGVVIDEAIELARRFGAEQSHRYVHGVLDRLAGQIERRAVERAARGRA